MRVLVCGGRDYMNYAAVSRALGDITTESIECIIHGASTGADELASQYARLHYIPEWRFPANWPQYGKKAGPLRNAEMLRISQPNLVLAFEGGKGTADMIKKARWAGIPVREIP